MIIKNPDLQDIPALRALWKQAFEDTDSFLDSFFSLAFSTERALIAKEKDQLLGALYWFDCVCGAEQLAYIYAVATDQAYRNRGVCTALMEELHTQMEQAGKGTILVPAEDSLREFYRHMGYRDFGGIEEATYFAGDVAFPAEKLTADTYAKCRRKLLPEGSVLQEGAFLPFLADNMQFYGGEDWLLAIQNDFAPEFLGDQTKLPGILNALQLPKVKVRFPGQNPFAMYRTGKKAFTPPGYFAFALD